VALNNPKPSFDWVSEYQTSALPFVTSSIVGPGSINELEFALVTKQITIRNTSLHSGSNIAVGFTRNGLITGNNQFSLMPGESFSADFRIKSLFISGTTSGASGSYTIIAGLTTIPAKMMPKLTGSTGGSSGSFSYDGIG